MDMDCERYITSFWGNEWEEFNWLAEQEAYSKDAPFLPLNEKKEQLNSIFLNTIPHIPKIIYIKIWKLEYIKDKIRIRYIHNRVSYYGKTEEQLKHEDKIISNWLEIDP
jgi:hypothetical protein